MQDVIMDFPILHTHITIENLINTLAKVYTRQFPKGYFKHLYLEDQIHYNDTHTRNQIINKKKLPYIYITYDVDYDANNTTGQMKFLQNYRSHYLAGNFENHYLRIYYNPNSRMQIFVPFTRIKITFNVSIGVASVREQQDMMLWLINNFRFGEPATILNDFPGLAAIPQSMIDYIGMLQGYNLKNEELKKKHYSDIEKYSSGLISNKKLITDMNVHTFFLKYNMHECQLRKPEDPQPERGDKKNMVPDIFRINHTMELEPHIPMCYIVKSPEIVNGKKIPKKYRHTITRSDVVDSRIKKALLNDNHTLKIKPMGWKIILNEDYVTPQNGEFEIDLSEVLAADYMYTYDRLLKAGHPIFEYFDIMLYHNGVPMAKTKDFTINNSTYKIHMNSAKMNEAYKIIISISEATMKPLINAYHMSDIDEIVDKLLIRIKNRKK